MQPGYRVRKEVLAILNQSLKVTHYRETHGPVAVTHGAHPLNLGGSPLC